MKSRRRRSRIGILAKDNSIHQTRSKACSFDEKKIRQGSFEYSVSRRISKCESLAGNNSPNSICRTSTAPNTAPNSSRSPFLLQNSNDANSRRSNRVVVPIPSHSIPTGRGHRISFILSTIRNESIGNPEIMIAPSRRLPSVPSKRWTHPCPIDSTPTVVQPKHLEKQQTPRIPHNGPVKCTEKERFNPFSWKPKRRRSSRTRRIALLLSHLHTTPFKEHKTYRKCEPKPMGWTEGGNHNTHVPSSNHREVSDHQSQNKLYFNIWPFHSNINHTANPHNK